MEQKDYKLEIVNVLAKGKNHIRGISKKLNVNHMMIVRKISILERENVVDFVEEGRNKIYFLKDNSESRNYVLTGENYKLNNLILNHAFLREIILKIQRDKKIKFACVFGSYAKCIEKKESDIDIYLDVDKIEIKKEYSSMDSKFSIKIGKWDKKNLLIKEIIENHIIIKGGELYYERVFE